MTEELLQYVWKVNCLPLKLHGAKGEAIQIVKPGRLNTTSGPDFFNAQIAIDDQLWAGNIEIHKKASDWYAHHHEQDNNYDNVILHVVWEADMEIFRLDNSSVVTLELQSVLDTSLLDKYHDLMRRQKAFINCERAIASFPQAILRQWTENMFFSRLEEKSIRLQNDLKETQNHWEAVLFRSLMRNFGLNTNGDFFYDAARSFNFSVVQKIRHKPILLEALLFGITGLLEKSEIHDRYFYELQENWIFLVNKFGLKVSKLGKARFFRLRPNNFPTIRLSQLANLYHKKEALFAQLIEIQSKEQYYELFKVHASNYWDGHYSFGVTNGERRKKLTKPFIDLLIVNTLVPLIYCHAQFIGIDVNNRIIKIIESVSAEKNSIAQNFKNLGVNLPSAFESQAVLHSYNNYCQANKCLKCTLGHQWMKTN